MATDSIRALRDAYQTRVTALTDSLSKARAQVALDAYIAAEGQYQEILAAAASSYSTTGRSITKRTIESAEAARNSARAELEGCIGGPDGGVSYVDNGGRIL